MRIKFDNIVIITTNRAISSLMNDQILFNPLEKPNGVYDCKEGEVIGGLFDSPHPIACRIGDVDRVINELEKRS